MFCRTFGGIVCTFNLHETDLPCFEYFLLPKKYASCYHIIILWNLTKYSFRILRKFYTISQNFPSYSKVFLLSHVLQPVSSLSLIFSSCVIFSFCPTSHCTTSIFLLAYNREPQELLFLLDIYWCGINKTNILPKRLHFSIR